MRLLLVASLCMAVACRSAPPRDRVIVIGLDGMDPDVIARMVAEGQLPTFARLGREGAFGRLESSHPILSPIIWTTIATGKTPDAHGIGHFVAVNPQTGKQLPVTSRMRRVKAIWNILSDAQRKVAVVGWWATWPAEAVHGAIVSDHTCYHFLFPEGETGAGEPVGITHPPELLEKLRPLVRRPADITPEEAAAFVHVSPEEFARPFAFDDDLSHFRWALATADSYRRIGLDFLQHDRPDVLMVYIEGTDSVSHLFGHLVRAEGLKGELAAQQERYGGAVEAMYRWADRLVGEYVAAMDEHTTLVVLSDHGFSLGELPDDPSRTRDMRRVSERFHRIEGILYLFGHRVRPGRKIEKPVLLDVAPTLLALAGVAPAQDMPGRVLSEALDLGEGPPRVATYESAPRQADAAAAAEPAVDDAIIKRLESLGYLDASSPRGDRSLAAMDFQAGRYAEAAAKYEALLRDDPNDGELHASLAGTLGALGRYDEALEHLRVSIEQRPLNPEAHHNRATIYEKQGKRDEAIAEYQAALKIDGRYEPSRRAMMRLTGSPPVGQAPKNDAQRLAVGILQRAEQAARRGDYDGATQALDEAERIAPRYALVHQYRSNVAYLRGDRTTAIAALKRALEIDPDNPLYRTNLDRLEKETDGTR
jgi:predicted AlkP superfamily phosphohydrolase/phosphomutase/tetratricopeptide (TPR) repeat protein